MGNESYQIGLNPEETNRPKVTPLILTWKLIRVEILQFIKPIKSFTAEANLFKEEIYSKPVHKFAFSLIVS